VILTDPEGGRDYIEHGKTGMLVPYPDVAALRDAILYLWQNAEEARGMGERGREAALPLTTERCNVEIWNLAFGLIASRRTDQMATEQRNTQPDERPN
jgi:glycosyltransferase involved in cell wall biosynthesis